MVDHSETNAAAASAPTQTLSRAATPTDGSTDEVGAGETITPPGSAPAARLPVKVAAAVNVWKMKVVLPARAVRVPSVTIWFVGTAARPGPLVFAGCSCAVTVIEAVEAATVVVEVIACPSLRIEKKPE